MPSLIVPLPPETSALLQPYQVIVDEVAALVGGQDDEEMREKARILVDRAADHMNMAGVYLHQLKEATYTATVDYPAAVEKLALPSDWGWPEGHFYTFTSDGSGGHKLYSQCDWVDWPTFIKYRQRTAVSDRSDGKPKLASIRSEVEDGNIYFYPYPDPDGVSQIVVPYFSRIARPSETTLLLVTPEIRECLITGGQAMMMQYRHAKLPGVWRSWQNDFERTIEKAKAADARRQQALYYWAQVDVPPIQPYYHSYGYYSEG